MRTGEGLPGGGWLLLSSVLRAARAPVRHCGALGSPAPSARAASRRGMEPGAGGSCLPGHTRGRGPREASLCLLDRGSLWLLALWRLTGMLRTPSFLRTSVTACPCLNVLRLLS